MNTSTATFGHDLPDPDAAPDPDPMPLLRAWVPTDTGELRPLMTLSTLDADGRPDIRNVLLSSVDADGVCFHTDLTTRKAAQLAADPRVALAVVWPDAGRQVTVQGDARRTTPQEDAAAFAARSRYLQLLAWVNTPELAALPTAQRRERWDRFAAEHPPGSLTPPSTWIGFRVVPVRVTFWRGDADGPSNRVEHRRGPDGWHVTRLPG